MVPLGDTLEDLDADGVVLETLRRDQGGPERLIEVLAAAFVHRLPVTWTGLLPGRHVDLPTYAFQHGRYWLDEPARSVEPDGLGLAAAGHPLLGAVVESAQDGRVMFTGRLSQSSHPWLAGHAVLGTVIVPGTALLEMAAWAGGEVCRPTSRNSPSTPLSCCPTQPRSGGSTRRQGHLGWCAGAAAAAGTSGRQREAVTMPAG